MQLKVSTRIIAGFAVLALILLGTAASAIWLLNQLGETTAKLAGQTLPQQLTTAALERNALLLDRQLLAAKVSADPAELARWRSPLQQSLNAFDTALTALPPSATLSTLEALSRDLRQSQAQLVSQHEARLLQDEEITLLSEELLDKADFVLEQYLELDEELAFEDNAALLSSLVTNQQSRFRAIVGSATDLLTEQQADVRQSLFSQLDAMASKMQRDLAYLYDQLGRLDASIIPSGLQANSGQLLAYFEGDNALQREHANRDRLRDASEASYAQALGQLERLLSQLGELSERNLAAAQQSRERSSSTVRVATTAVAIITGLGLLLACAVGFWILRSISRPLERINHALEAAAQGDLSRRLDDAGSDEFALLSRRCNHLIDSLCELLREIADSANQLLHATNISQRITEESEHSVSHQRDQVEQVAAATSQLAGSAVQVKVSSEQSLDGIRQVEQQAATIAGLARDNRQTTEQLTRQLKQAETVIGRLEKNSASISQVVEVIRDISEQTNLLALNAAIEAARAGEQGRGFAVVADEVRNLASRTQRSTEEIQSMIGTLQQGAQDAVAAMQTSLEQSEKGLQQTTRVDGAAGAIAGAIEQSHQHSAQITVAANEQNQVTHAISEKLETIVSLAEENARGIDQIRGSSHELASLSQRLNQAVGQFKMA